MVFIPIHYLEEKSKFKWRYYAQQAHIYFALKQAQVARRIHQEAFCLGASGDANGLW